MKYCHANTFPVKETPFLFYSVTVTCLTLSPSRVDLLKYLVLAKFPFSDHQPLSLSLPQELGAKKLGFGLSTVEVRNTA